MRWFGEGLPALARRTKRNDHRIAALRLSAFYDEEAGYFKRSYCSNPAAAMAGTCTPLATTGITTVDNVGAIDACERFHAFGRKLRGAVL